MDYGPLKIIFGCITPLSMIEKYFNKDNSRAPYLIALSEFFEHQVFGVPVTIDTDYVRMGTGNDRLGFAVVAHAVAELIVSGS